MKYNIKSYKFALICTIILICIQFNKILAQNNSNVKEPPVPVYVISPYHEDGLSSAYEGFNQDKKSLDSTTIRRLDTLQLQLNKSSGESTLYFIWLYALIALLGIMNIVLLFSTSRIKKEVTQLKRFEHHKMILSTESSALLQPAPKIIDASVVQEPAQLTAPARIRKPRTLKPRVKKQKKL